MLSRGNQMFRLDLCRSISTSSVTSYRGRTQAARKGPVKSLAQIEEEERKGRFRVLNIGLPDLTPSMTDNSKRPDYMTNDKRQRPTTERHLTLKPTDNWEKTWPATRTFHPGIVPLPIRQGYVQLKAQVTPSKYANVELMKVPNFLHLTPPVVREHCKRIEKFCTKWPLDDTKSKALPMTITTSTYLNSSSSIRDWRARIVTLRVPLDSLKLTPEAREKLLRLARDNYDPINDELLIVADACTYRKQNLDYAEYILTALYHEANATEEWESATKTSRDERYFNEDMAKEIHSGDLDHRPALKNILNEGENRQSLDEYAKAVEKMFLKSQ